MSKLRILAAAAVLAVAAPAFAQEAELNGAWDTKYGMIFALNNILQVDPILSPYDPDGANPIAPGIGFQYNLAPDRALRFSLNFSRASDKPVENEHKEVTGSTTVITKTQINPAYTGIYDLGLGAAYVIRMGTAALAPYYGAGVGLGFGLTNRDFEDKINDDPNVHKYDTTNMTFDLGVSALLGAEWRVHKVISVFAEYGVNLSLVSYAKNKTVTEDTVGTVKTTTTDENSKTTFVNINTGLNVGGQLGVLAHF